MLELDRNRNRKCDDLKCVRKPTKSRLSLTHHANKSNNRRAAVSMQTGIDTGTFSVWVQYNTRYRYHPAVEQNKTLNGPYGIGIAAREWELVRVIAIVTIVCSSIGRYFNW